MPIRDTHRTQSSHHGPFGMMKFAIAGQRRTTGTGHLRWPGPRGGSRVRESRHLTGGGVPSALAARVISHPHTAQACRKADRANATPAAR
jgi:hypothetical protein